eukprot:10126759-Ditylum_brightwellii.AAC.1
MIMRFKDQYFNYKGIAGEDNGKTNADDNSIAIGLCFWHVKYKGICQNNGLVIFLGKLNQNELALWLKSFQLKVDTLVGGTCFQFTTKIWTPDKEIEEINNGLDKQQQLDK